MNIDELLNKYFEGTTSCEEERELRRFFKKDDIPEHLQIYHPLFAYLAQEAESRKDQKEVSEKENRSLEATHAPQSRLLHRTLYTLTGIAAGLLLFIGIAKTISLPSVAKNYVIIDGRCYTDKKLIEVKALEALQNAGFTDDDLSSLLFQH
ncbi:hypothetical protein JN06_00855 [Bacteroides zoogleoformans]|uniref:Uncharacterized protein n=1 Tax=Bacteroides zoogleoformans TaxID=28119 RepID=A0ABM6T9B7_9BACE|nr:hypothetical protein [Bacteroides zoogleoformans]AVM53405.1 hypothetical protein C4H11_11115 [Bacteroides zoogleoformans]TWJ17262.1 hypothetical protein JN06_00855 [Bacteroides zoogleoformans]